MAQFSIDSLLNDPSLAPLAGIRVAQERGDLAIESATLLRDILAFDADGGSGLAGVSGLLQSGEFAAAESLLDHLREAEPQYEDQYSALETRLAASRAEAGRDYAEQTRLLLERVATARGEVAIDLRTASSEVIASARRARLLAERQLGLLRERVEQQVIAGREALHAELDRIEAKTATVPEELARARRALELGDLDLARWLIAGSGTEQSTAGDLTAPGPKPWIEATPVRTALEWLDRRTGPPGFVERWAPSADDTAAVTAVAALQRLAESNQLDRDAFSEAAAALDALFGGDGAVPPATAGQGALSTRLPSLTLSELPWFRPGAQNGGLALVVPAVSGAGLPVELGPGDLALVVRFQAALQKDERAIRLEAGQLIPLLADPHRQRNIWRLIGTRTPLERVLFGVDELLSDPDAKEWREDRQLARHIASSVLDLVGHRDTPGSVLDGVVHVSAGIPALVLALLEALLVVLGDRSGGRSAPIGADDLRSATWHSLYLDRIWTSRLLVLEGDREAQIVFAAVRCAAGAAPTATFTLDVEEIADWASMADLPQAEVAVGLRTLASLGLVDLDRDGATIGGSTSGLALIAARKQGPPEDLLSSHSH